VSQLWGGVSWGWLVEGAVVEGWGRGGVTILWCRVRLGQGGEGWRRPCLGGGRDEVGGYGRWIHCRWAIGRSRHDV